MIPLRVGTGHVPGGATAAALIVLSTAVLAACSDSEEGRAFRAPSSESVSTAPSDATPAPPGDTDPPTDQSLAECTDGNCTVDLTTGDSIDFEAGVGIEELRVDEVGEDDLTLTGRGEPNTGGLVCSGGCSVSIRDSSRTGTTAEIRADEGARMVLGGFELQVLDVSDGTARVRLGSG